MSCDPEALRHVPLFALLDDEETAVLAGQVELKKFAPRQRIYKIGDATGQAYVMVSGRVRVTTLDQDHQEVVIDEPAHGEFFGFASMLERTPHQTNAIALEESECIEVDRNDIAVLLQRKPMAGMDMLTVLGKQFHASQQLVRVRASRNANEVIEEEATVGQRVADKRHAAQHHIHTQRRTNKGNQNAGDQRRLHKFIAERCGEQIQVRHRPSGWRRKPATPGLWRARGRARSCRRSGG